MGALRGASQRAFDARTMGDEEVELEEIDNATDGTAEAGASDSEVEAIEVPEVGTAQDLEAVYDIPVQVSAVLGKSTMEVNELLRLGRGAVVELDRKVGEAIDIYVNNRLVARGEVVVLEDKLGITMTEIFKSDHH